jgi:hypothetical protein
MHAVAEERLENLARAATKCRECFRLGEVVDPFITVAQPRWVGTKYWQSKFRMAVLMLNPGQSREDERAKAFLARIRSFRDGTTALRSVLEHQRDGMKLWGNSPGRFTGFYIDGLGLNLDEVAFANVAWCGTAENRYPRTMLERCFERHTAPLLDLLRPNVILASGGPTHRFAKRAAKLIPGTHVIKILHYAHREGRIVERKELLKIRSELAKARGRCEISG